jgi:hypothetical protein
VRTQKCDHMFSWISLGQPQPVVQHVREPVPGPGPGLDLEPQRVAVGGRSELDLPGLQVTIEGGELERGGVLVNHPPGGLTQAWTWNLQPVFTS